MYLVPVIVPLGATMVLDVSAISTFDQLALANSEL